MKREEKEQLVSLYESRYEKCGGDVKTLGWGNVESQILRFEILSDIADLSKASVCDLGCGFGDLYYYLQKRFGSVEYHGIDISGKLIGEAKRKYPDTSFEIRDILIDPPADNLFDYVLSSGALSFKIEDHEDHIENMLKCMFKMSRRGVAVNFLSSYVDFELEKNFHFPPERALALGKSMSRFVSLRHDYPLYEFTLYIYKVTDNQKKK